MVSSAKPLDGQDVADMIGSATENADLRECRQRKGGHICMVLAIGLSLAVAQYWTGRCIDGNEFDGSGSAEPQRSEQNTGRARETGAEG